MNLNINVINQPEQGDKFTEMRKPKLSKGELLEVSGKCRQLVASSRGCDSFFMIALQRSFDRAIC